jgi:hypothetical protein
VVVERRSRPGGKRRHGDGGATDTRVHGPSAAAGCSGEQETLSGTRKTSREPVDRGIPWTSAARASGNVARSSRIKAPVPFDSIRPPSPASDYPRTPSSPDASSHRPEKGKALR